MKSKFFKEYFSFSIRERNGILVIFIILLLVISSGIIIKNHKNETKHSFEKFENEINTFSDDQVPGNIIPVLFHFDPNNATHEDLIQLGLSSKATNNILNYRNKGGKFYKPEDLKKIYSITDDDYQILKDYIIIKNTNSGKQKLDISPSKIPEKKELFEFDPNTTTKEDFLRLGLRSYQIDNIIKFRNKGGVFHSAGDLSKIYGIDHKTFEFLKPYINIRISKTTSESTVIFTIDLNTADEQDLQKLKGIGPAYSKRIIEYRNKLGGYTDIDQLMEIYGFSVELIQNIKDNITIGSNHILKININTAGYKELISHPYIDKDNTIKIINYRNFAKEINSFYELLEQKAISEEFYNKLSPYITTE